MITRLQVWLVAAIAVLAALVGAYGYGAKRARDAVRLREQARATNAMEIRRDENRDAAVIPVDAVDERLHDRWSRR